MSGHYTVQYVLEVTEQPFLSPSDQAEMKSIGLMDNIGRIDPAKLDEVKQQAEENDQAKIHVLGDGSYKFIVDIEPSSSKGKGKEEMSSSDRMKFSAENVKALIEGKSLTINKEDIKTVLEKYMKELPKTPDTYKSGEVKIQFFKGVLVSISSLLSAGTKILDAILFISYQNSSEHNFIFTKEELNPEFLVKKQLVDNIDIGNKAIKAAFCCVYNQGGLPSKSKDPRGLSKFIRETIFHDSELDSNTFCDMLSCTNPMFFPSSVFLEIPLDDLPTEVSSRCKMSIAGNKAIRYAVIAQKHEKAEIKVPEKASEEENKEYFKKLGLIEKARSITTLLCSISSNFDAQKRMHPLSSTRPSRKNFTLQLTSAIVYSLSGRGREALHREIDDKKIEAFKRDPNIYGQKTSADVLVFPVLKNPDADFAELSVEAVKAAYKLV